MNWKIVFIVAMERVVIVMELALLLPRILHIPILKLALNVQYAMELENVHTVAALENVGNMSPAIRLA